MSRHRLSATWAADYAEREAGRRYRRELDLNRVIETRNPTLKPSAEYLRTAKPNRVFFSRTDRIEWETRRQMAKFDPFVSVDRWGSRRRER